MMTSVCLPSVPFRTTVLLRTILSDMCGDCERLPAVSADATSAIVARQAGRPLMEIVENVSS